MDYTLAEYVPETFDLLAYDGAIEKLVNTMGYPAAVLDLVYDPHAYMRGLVIDKKRGNLLKLDRHKYVKAGRPIASPLPSRSGHSSPRARAGCDVVAKRVLVREIMDFSTEPNDAKRRKLQEQATI